MAGSKAPVTVHFRITMSRGVFRGITIDEREFTFPSRRSALEWVRGVRVNIARGGLDYMLDSFTITSGRTRTAVSNPGSTKKPLRNQRDKKSGQYAHGMDAVCKCGHRAGNHTYGGGNGCGECIVHEDYDGPAGKAWRATHGDDACDCLKFRKAR